MTLINRLVASVLSQALQRPLGLAVGSPGIRCRESGSGSTVNYRGRLEKAQRKASMGLFANAILSFAVSVRKLCSVSRGTAVHLTTLKFRNPMALTGPKKAPIANKYCT